MKYFLVICTTLLNAFLSISASAGQAVPWQKGFQEAASPVMEKLVGFHDFLFVLIVVISLFVLILMGFICLRFSRKSNPNPSKTAHHTLLEIIWTAIPVVIVVAIVVKSLPILYYMNRSDDSEMTLKVIGYQWYWGYQYPDHGNIEFESYMIKDEDIKEGQIRLLSVDEPVILPVDTKIRVQLTAADVIHSWAIPALGLKTDAVPGRLNETWVTITKEGDYYGQCSELCGSGHGFMPIHVKAVSKEEFAAWSATKAPAPTESESTSPEAPAENTE